MILANPSQSKLIQSKPLSLHELVNPSNMTLKYIAYDGLGSCILTDLTATAKSYLSSSAISFNLEDRHPRSKAHQLDSRTLQQPSIAFLSGLQGWHLLPINVQILA